jgi:hypothetical protein
LSLLLGLFCQSRQRPDISGGARARSSLLIFCHTFPFAPPRFTVQVCLVAWGTRRRCHTPNTDKEPIPATFFIRQDHYDVIGDPSTQLYSAGTAIALAMVADREGTVAKRQGNVQSASAKGGRILVLDEIGRWAAMLLYHLCKCPASSRSLPHVSPSCFFSHTALLWSRLRSVPFSRFIRIAVSDRKHALRHCFVCVGGHRAGHCSKPSACRQKAARAQVTGPSSCTSVL